MIFSVEMNIVMEEKYHTLDGWQVITAIISLLSSFSYSHRDLLGVYTVCTLYNLIRTYFWIESFYRYVKYNTYFILTFGIMYAATRNSIKNQREKFVKT